MLALTTLLMAIVLSMVVVKVAAVALTLTGLSSDSARFQARSAFTGAGFTTAESEQVVGHPVRRRIVMTLMLLGNAGIVTVVSTMVLSFAQDKDAEPHWYESRVFLGALLVLGLYTLWKLSSSKLVDRVMTRVIERALRRWTDLVVRDYVALFRLQGEYEVAEMVVEADGWMAGKSLIDLRLSQEGVLVLGIERGEGYIGAPKGTMEVEAGDRLVLYGRGEVLTDLDERPEGLEGYRAHIRSLQKQYDVVEKELELCEGGGKENPAGV